MKVQSRELISERLIGKGTSSIVYETTWGGRSFARKDFLGVPKEIFEEEAKALVDLKYHDNVVKTYCWTVDEESCSLVTELMADDLHSLVQRRMAAERKKLNPGGSGSSGASQATSHVIDLQQCMKDRKKASVATSSESVASPPLYPFSMQEAFDIMLQIAEGMKFLHDKGVVHGDLKPKNVFVTSRLFPVSPIEVRVADFGLLGTKTKSRALVSRQARKLDTVRWRAGELFNSSFLTEDEDDSSTDSEDWDSDSGKGESSVVHKYEVPTKYSDVYSFGLTCSQILTGEDPYSGLGLHDLVKNIRDPDGLRPELPPTCPIRLRKLIESCWSEKDSRPSFDSIVSDLRDVWQASLTPIRTLLEVESLDINVKAKSSLVGIKEETIPKAPLELTEPSLQVGSERSTDSSKSSGRPGGSPNLLPFPEANIGVPGWHKKRESKDLSTESNMSSHEDHVSYTSAPQVRENFGPVHCPEPSHGMAFGGASLGGMTYGEGNFGGATVALPYAMGGSVVIQAPEMPSRQIEVRLHFTNWIFLSRVRSALQEHNMALDAHHGDHNIIVTGSPPEAGFHAADILAIVRKYDRAARIIESSNETA